jgi:hypothetical protein
MANLPSRTTVTAQRVPTTPKAMPGMWTPYQISPPPPTRPGVLVALTAAHQALRGLVGLFILLSLLVVAMLLLYLVLASAVSIRDVIDQRLW